MSPAILAGIVGREFKRVLRSRPRLASTFARPLIWLIIIGSGFSTLIPGGQFSYHKYLLPGIIGMVILFSSLLSALGSIQDREFGSMRMLLIAPVPRGLIVLGKALSATLLGAAFAIVLTPLAWVFRHPLRARRLRQVPRRRAALRAGAVEPRACWSPRGSASSRTSRWR